jgi:signal transduction histidine kinase
VDFGAHVSGLHVRAGTGQMALLVLLLVAVLGLFVAAVSGQRRLEEASRQVEIDAQRGRALADVLQLLSRAESAQRGFILLGDATYLEPFEESTSRLPDALRQLDKVFAGATAPVRAEVDEIEHLSAVKLDELGETLRLYRLQGADAAIGLVRTDMGELTMTHIGDRASRLQTLETQNMIAASHTWRNDRWVTWGITGGALAAALYLVVVLRRVVLRYVRIKERETVELQEWGTELEQQLRRRNEELSELSTHLQALAEREKSQLSRELHDELGGLLVAARMDVSWIEERMAANDPELRSRFARVQEALQSGVEIKRRVVENLRPTLLDNLGLFPALRWQVADSCSRAGLGYVEHLPPVEPRLTPDAAIALFRILQEALTNIVKHAQARTVEIDLEMPSEWLVLRVRDDGVGLPPDRLRALGSHGLSAMRHRATALGGSWRAVRRRDHGTEIEVRLPLNRVLARAVPAHA